jgi:aminopeptidase N
MCVAMLLAAPLAVCAVPPPITKYHADVTLDIAAKTVTGTTTIEVDAPAVRDGAATLEFPLNGLVIESASVNGKPVSFRTVDRKLAVTLPVTSAAGKLKVAFRYRAQPQQGIVFGGNFAYTVFSTCHWMVCRETSGDKAAFSIDITVPRQYAVVASGDLVNAEVIGDGMRRHRWEQRRPYSPYLFGFAVGEFTEARDDTPAMKLRFLGVDESAADLKKKFRDTGRMLRFFEAKAGVALPHNTYTQVLVPQSAAQELSTFSIVGKSQLDPILDNPEEDWVIAHELAHQWWGNLITCRDWSHFWLNEGLVVFMTAAYKEERWGRAAYDREMALARQRAAAAVEAGFDVPLAFAGEYPSLRIKRAIVYSKGALFLDVLREAMGDEKFWAGLRQYTQTHLGGTVESRDFQRAMERAHGKSLSALFEKWVFGVAAKSGDD